MFSWKKKRPQDDLRSRDVLRSLRLLGLGQAARHDEVKRQFRLLAMRYHPDRNPGDRLAEERFKRITHAYNTLRLLQAA